MRCEWRRRCRSKSSGEPMILFRSLFLQLLVPFVLALSVLLFIISINTNRRAVMFRSSDFGIVGDWEEFLPPLIEELRPILLELQES